MTKPSVDQPIGVFDSGIGGLTVLKALADRLPREAFIYLGDTARLPYGTKSPASIERYACQAAEALVARGIKLLVVACNTASAVAIEPLRKAFPFLPVIGVVEPGARAASMASSSGRIGVLATEGTVRGGAYEKAIRSLRPDAQVVSQACSLFVALAEEGWNEGAVAELAARRYLEPMLHSNPGVDCLVLGCTHFPVLSEVIGRVATPAVRLVDSAETTAKAVRDVLIEKGLEAAESSSSSRRMQFMATDGAARFARVGRIFLGRPIEESEVELVDL